MPLGSDSHQHQHLLCDDQTHRPLKSQKFGFQTTCRKCDFESKCMSIVIFSSVFCLWINHFHPCPQNWKPRWTHATSMNHGALGKNAPKTWVNCCRWYTQGCSIGYWQILKNHKQTFAFLCFKWDFAPCPLTIRLLTSFSGLVPKLYQVIICPTKKAARNRDRGPGTQHIVRSYKEWCQREMAQDPKTSNVF